MMHELERLLRRQIWIERVDSVMYWIAALMFGAAYFGRWELRSLIFWGVAFVISSERSR